MSIAVLNPKRGPRQGDPLSPYLFIIIAYDLSRMVNASVDNRVLRGLKLARSCPTLSHCPFADDYVFFIKATKDNCTTLREILDKYCLASGQLVNLEKSCTFFSENTLVDVNVECGQALGIGNVESPGKYLGLPILWGRSKTEALAFVRDKLKNKIQGWKQILLSRGGREVLIKTVANAIPTFPMSCFKFSRKTCMELDSLIANFWWVNKKMKDVFTSVLERSCRRLSLRVDWALRTLLILIWPYLRNRIGGSCATQVTFGFIF